MTAVSALAIAAPAAAQFERDFEVRGDAEFSAQLDQRIDRFEQRIDAGVEAGAIDRAEARRLSREMMTLTRLDRQYARDGYTQRERAELVSRLRTLRQNIRIADGGMYERDRRYGANDDWNGEDGYTGRGGPYDSDGDGWDDRDCDRDGDVDSGSCTAQQQQQRGGLGGFIDTILGGGGLRVGQRVTGDLYAVPSEYRTRYRDDSRYYYRSDGRRIYQIDSRTDVVTRIHAMP
jgi:hypothetical protein